MNLLCLISLGAGVQSSTMALMAKHGEIEPMPDGAIFADTQAEPKAVYEWLDWLERRLPFPVYRVTAGNLRQEILGATEGKRRMDGRPPFFLSTGGMLRRQCTQDYKLIPIQRKQRELLGLKFRQRAPKTVAIEQWIGISLDETHRMKDSRLPYIRHRWPLIEMRMTRRDCLRWMKARNYPEPPKSACTFCPYHDDALWRKMKTQDPESFHGAVVIDKAIRHGAKNRDNGKPLSPAKWFVHRKLLPLEEVEFIRSITEIEEERGQGALFGNECEGLCGV